MLAENLATARTGSPRFSLMSEPISNVPAAK